MNVSATERRFVCPACKHVHLTWAPRCAGCTSLAGLILVTGSEVDRGLPAQPSPPAVDEEPQEFVRLVRPPRLSIARSPDEPELTRPVEELVDLDPAEYGPVPV